MKCVGLLALAIAVGSANNLRLKVDDEGTPVAIADTNFPRTHRQLQDVPGDGPSLPDPKTKKILFGTLNGYDVGGTDPLCWTSRFSTENSTASEEISNGIELLNEQLFELADSAVLLPQCYNGTKFTVKPVSLNDGGVMMLGKPYTFTLELDIDLRTIAPRLRNADLQGVKELHFRLHLCDAVRQGFCNPIRDTRERDASLTRAEADVVPEENSIEEFQEGEAKWAYSENMTLIALSDDDQSLTLYGRWCRWRLRQQEGTLFKTAVNITLQIPMQQIQTFGQKPYFFLGHAVVGFDLGNDEVIRLDVAQTAEEKVVYLKLPPQLLVVSKTAKIVIGVGIGMVAAFALFCFVIIVRNQEHAVMRLAQGRFLAIMAFACLVQAVFTYTFIPSQNVNCILKGPMVLIPLTLVGAVLVARVWRVYSTLSNASNIGRNHGLSEQTKPFFETGFVAILDFMAGLSRFPGKSSPDGASRGSRRQSMRRTVTERESFGVIFVLTLPQVVLQIIVALIAPSELVEDYNSLGHVGRVICSDRNMWAYLAGTGYATLVFLLAVLMAWFSRDLPSAFNEKDQIFHAATISALTTGMSIGVGTIISAPTTSPDADVMLWGWSSLTIAGSISFLIIWPKVARVRSGERVVVSKLLGSRFSSSTSETASAGADHSDTHGDPTHANTNGDHTHGLAPSASEEPKTRRRITATDAIPSRVEKKVFEVQGLLKNILKKSGDGKTLSKDDWNQVRGEVDELKAQLDGIEVS